MWTKPTATEMRFGFEVTMYVMNKQLYNSITYCLFGTVAWKQPEPFKRGNILSVPRKKQGA